ncbi:MAG: Muramoyltetrapeptide carboxypeptidase [uncultured Sphingosinicella sp.]|uniref:Muramoyltetrapeptide carboxypeptidase n=1 Tax=uncultured Sphingosinicella sp. TaxID=478748 RepID=A0A6J4U2Y2_9SPHN|nr:LD-carboxypeptidase [uncultured Sphingosinicella sp.]CAA9537946.1 MAG: Muramoyltetrapeptide carboxypeptidase [uncultured Sphingosinicella sp.]
MRIGVVAPSTPIETSVADRVLALAAEHHPGVEIVFHPQCFVVHKHFAGTDADRAQAFLEVANDPSFDALWHGRGGYGSNRIAEAVLPHLSPAARDKTYIGYSDAGFILGALYRAGFPHLVHAPMPADIKRDGGEAAVLRVLDWFVADAVDGLEPSIDGSAPVAAFNITVLSHMLGTPLEPDLSGHVLILEDVSEHTYRTDRALFHITSSPNVRKVAGIRLGRCSLVPENDPDFGDTEEEILRFWCERAGIPFLGSADIGHDADNKIVPFGRARPAIP